MTATDSSGVTAFASLLAPRARQGLTSARDAAEAPMLWRAIVWILLLWLVGTPVAAALRGELPPGLKELVLVGALIFAILVVFGRIFPGRRDDDDEEAFRFQQQRQRAARDAYHRGRRDW